MTQDHDAPPFNPLPPAVWVLALALAGVELVFLAGGQGLISGTEAMGWRLGAAQRFGVSSEVLEWMVVNRQFAPEHALRFLAYPLIQTNTLQAVFLVVVVLALGKVIGTVLRGATVIAVFFLAAAVGGLVFGTLAPGFALLVGGYPGMFGLLGAFAFLLGAGLTPAEITRTRALALILVLLVLRLVIGLTLPDGERWIADLSAFAAGAGLAAVLRPGGWRALRALVRHR